MRLDDEWADGAGMADAYCWRLDILFQSAEATLAAARRHLCVDSTLAPPPMRPDRHAQSYSNSTVEYVRETIAHLQTIERQLDRLHQRARRL